jgi:hypothetical protein
VTGVRFVKLYYPVINGVELSGASPLAISVGARGLVHHGQIRITVIAPALNSTTRPDPGNVYVQVTSATAVSYIGLAAQLFDEP